jgi:CRP/FNR family cyclic AMP-dependent transcriptional regulator
MPTAPQTSSQPSPNEGLVKLIRGIMLFKTFTPDEARMLLRVAESKRYEPRQIIYEAGAPSTEMLILVSGKLVVVTEKGIRVANIQAGESVGEIGVMTDQPRSARVVSLEKSAGLVIQKKDLVNLLKSEKDICIKFQANLIDMLSDRLRKTDKLLDTYAKEKPES